MNLEHLNDEREYSEWIKQIEANGATLKRVDCEDCDGSGEITCSHCGVGEVECDACNGSGKTTFPNLDDFLRMRRDERKLRELWSNGAPFPANYKGSYPLSQESREFLFDAPKHERMHATTCGIVALAIPQA